MKMEPKNIIQVSSREELRQWFEENHASCTEMWVRVKRGNRPLEGVVGYLDAVMEALCFGWIDSTLKKVDEGCPLQRFSPRRKGSHWTELNRQRCRQLIAEGLMTEVGLKEYEKAMSKQSLPPLLCENPPRGEGNLESDIREPGFNDLFTLI